MLRTVVIISSFFLFAAIPSKHEKMIRIDGETMATTYHITYFDVKGRNFKKSIDSLLAIVNKSINNYDPSSEVSVFNKSKRGIKFKLPYLLPPLRKSKEVFEASNGVFDPTVAPLVNAWGFGPGSGGSIPGKAEIDSLLAIVSFEKITFDEDSLWKTDERVQLDFGGIGQGYGADVIANFLRSKGVENMFVELGGEGMAVGRNLESGKPWRIGILDPLNNEQFKAYVSLSDRSFSTSGNYYNFREVDGQRISHTIDPFSGYGEHGEMKSITVFAIDCVTADAWDTALMVMGFDRAVEALKSHPELDAYMVFSSPTNGDRTFATPGILRQLELNK